MREAYDVDFVETESDVDALLMEARLVKDTQPKFNRDLRDDKSFPYLQITTHEDFPRVEVTREPQTSGVKLYGPFANAGSLRGAVQALQKVFKFRTCSLDIEADDERWRWFRPCLLASINQCTAPCNFRIGKEEYRKDIKRLRMFLEGNRKKLLKEMRAEMAEASTALRVRAGGPAARRDRFAREAQRAGRDRDARAARGVLHRSEEGPRRPAEDLQAGDAAAEHRRGRHRSPGRHRDGRQPGAVSRWPAVQARLPAISHSRRRGIDDYASIREVVARRFRKLRADGDVFPDVLLVDGGLGQLRRAMEAFEKLEIQPPLVLSLAKKEELVYVMNRSKPLRLSRRSYALRLLQYVRDEAHRFAQHYHHLLRRKRTLGE